MPRSKREDGFALPITIFVLAIVTLMLSAIFVRVQMDRRIADSSGAAVDALAIAQSGLQTYLATTNYDYCDRPIRPVDGDSIRINVTQGYADVVAHVVQKPADTLSGTWTYIVRSTGRLIEPTQGSDPQATRTVAQFAYWQQAYLDVQATWTLANGLRSASGGWGEFRGRDQARPKECRRPSVYPIRTPAGEGPSSLPGYSFNGKWPRIYRADSPLQVATQTGIDWFRTLTGGLVPDYNYIRTWDSSYPIMVITGSDTLDVSWTWGWGTIIVQDDLLIRGNRLQWYGVVLVGGRIIFEASDARFDGVVVTGLNERLGTDIPLNGLSNQYIDMDYDSRYVRRAMRSLAGFAPVANAWVDNWASF